MPKTPMAFYGGMLLLAIVAAAPVWADDVPMPKAGLWEFKTVSTAGSRDCVDAVTEKKTGIAGACPILSTRKTVDGYTIDVECDATGIGPIRWHLEVTGNFDSAYTIKRTADFGGANLVITTEAKWLGACPADWKPGDREIPGLGKLNLLD